MGSDNKDGFCGNRKHSRTVYNLDGLPIVVCFYCDKVVCPTSGCRIFETWEVESGKKLTSGK